MREERVEKFMFFFSKKSPVTFALLSLMVYHIDVSHSGCWSPELLKEFLLNPCFLLVWVLLFLCVILNLLGKAKREKYPSWGWASLLLTLICEKELLLHPSIRTKEVWCLPYRCRSTGNRTDWVVVYQRSQPEADIGQLFPWIQSSSQSVSQHWFVLGAGEAPVDMMILLSFGVFNLLVRRKAGNT